MFEYFLHLIGIMSVLRYAKMLVETAIVFTILLGDHGVVKVLNETTNHMKKLINGTIESAS